jgi:hypothetical protein
LPTGKAEDWSKVKHAFFTGPRTFVVEREGIKLRFPWSAGAWPMSKNALPITVITGG